MAEYQLGHGSELADTRLPSRKVENFNELPESRLLELKVRIEAAQGKIIVFVHPYYTEDTSIETAIGSPDPAVLNKMREALPTLLSVQKKDSPPIFIFHEDGKFDQLVSTLEGANIDMPGYVIPTISDDPMPVSGEWGGLLEKLDDLGVREITMAGMNLVIEWADDEMADPSVAGCVAIAANELTKKFKVRMSKFVYPNSKDDYANFGGPTGPDDHRFDFSI